MHSWLLAGLQDPEAVQDELQGMLEVLHGS